MDSSICTAAVHAGKIKRRDGGLVTIRIEQPIPQDTSSLRNAGTDDEVQSRNWDNPAGSYQSFSFSSVKVVGLPSQVTPSGMESNQGNSELAQLLAQIQSLEQRTRELNSTLDGQLADKARHAGAHSIAATSAAARAGDLFNSFTKAEEAFRCRARVGTVRQKGEQNPYRVSPAASDQPDLRAIRKRLGGSAHRVELLAGEFELRRSHQKLKPESPARRRRKSQDAGR